MYWYSWSILEFENGTIMHIRYIALILYAQYKQIKGPRNIYLKYLGHKMSSPNYEFGPLKYLFTLHPSCSARPKLQPAAPA